MSIQRRMAQPWLVWLALIGALIGAPAARAQGDLQVVPVLNPRTAYVGQTIQLELRVAGSRNVQTPTIDGVDWGTVQFVQAMDTSRTSRITVNGRSREDVFEGVTFIYLITPDVAGRHTVPPIRVRTNRGVLTTGPIQIAVREPEQSDEVKVAISVNDDAPFVGQPVKVTLELLVSVDAQNLRIGLPLDEGAALVAGLPEGAAPTGVLDINVLGVAAPLVREGVRRIDGEQFTVFRAQVIVMPQREGRFTLGPVSAGLDVVVRRSRSIFIGRDQTRPLYVAGNAIEFDVRPLPVEGRPTAFSGLIGRYDVETRVEPAVVNVGDPMTLEVEITGTQPLDAVPMIDLASQPGFADAFRLTGDDPPGVVGADSITFRRTIRATRDDVEALPPLQFNYFDVERGRYAVASSDPAPITVRPSRVVTSADAVGGVATGAGLDEAEGGVAHIYEGDGLLRAASPFTLVGAMRSPEAIAAAAAGPVGFTLLSLVMLVQRRARAGTDAGRRAKHAAPRARTVLDHAARAASPSDAASRAAEALLGYAADRFDRSPRSLTPDECRDLIATHAPAPAAADRFAAVLRRCDAVRFAGGGESVESLIAEARAALDAAEGR